MKVLITGSNGLLGQKIVKRFLAEGVEFLATSRGENRNPNCPEAHFRSMDITDVVDSKSVIDDYQPTAIINTAAMTNVDQCESEEENCRLINVKAVDYLYGICSLRDIYFVQVSTDFVFDGENGPYEETAQKNPLSVYATSKADAENILEKGDYPNWSILRTIILFGVGENLSRSNIVLWSMDALANGQELTIVNDQFRAPTWADDLADACYMAVRKSAKGIFHISGPETFSIYELVCRVADFFGRDRSLVRPISSDTLNQAAKRPPRTGFHIDKARNELDYHPLTFEQSLAELAKES